MDSSRLFFLSPSEMDSSTVGGGETVAAMTGLKLNRARKSAVAVTAAMRVVLRRENGYGFRVWIIWGLGFLGFDDDDDDDDALIGHDDDDDDLSEEVDGGRSGFGNLKEREEMGREIDGRW